MVGEFNPELSPNPEIVEPIALTFGATPFVFRPEQIKVYNALLDRIDQSAPGDTPQEIKNYVCLHFMSRFHRRQDTNSQSYQRRLVQDLSQLTPEMMALHDKAYVGTSNPDDILTVSTRLGMPSVELGRVTHPYGEHLEDLGELRLATEVAIKAHGGYVFDPHEYESYELEDADIGNYDKGTMGLGFLMIRKRLVGILPDGTEITERSSFIVRIDEASEFDQELAAKMRKVHFLENKYWKEDLLDAGDLLRVVPPLLDNDRFKTAIPLSSTIYANNPCVELEIQNRERGVVDEGDS